MALSSVHETFSRIARTISNHGRQLQRAIASGGDVQYAPDATLLEDRVLLNAAPVDVVDGPDGIDPTASTADVVVPHTSDTPDSNAPLGQLAQATTNLGESPDPLSADDQHIEINAHDRIVAYYGFSGGTDPALRKTSWGVAHNGWARFIEDHAQVTLDAGIDRFVFHMPFGARSYDIDPVTGQATVRPGEALYQFDAYLDAQQQLPTMTDDFVSAFQDFFAANEENENVQNAMVYIGSPRHDAQQKALIDDPDAWWERAYDIITPLLEAGFRHIGFDASAPALPDTLDFALHDVLRNTELRDPVRDARLIDIVGDESVEVYLEAVPYRDTGRTDYPIFLMDYTWNHQDPDEPGPHQATHQERFFEHDEFTGEIIRQIRSEQWEVEGLSIVEEILSDGHAAAATPSFFLRTQNGGADTLDALVDKLDVPGLPTLFDLDVDDVNPETATFTILQGPQHGTLTANDHYDDVFTYTPDDYYSGVDTIEFVVQDGDQTSTKGSITFYVGVDAPPDVAAENTGANKEQPQAPSNDIIPPPPVPPSAGGVQGQGGSSDGGDVGPTTSTPPTPSQPDGQSTSGKTDNDPSTSGSGQSPSDPQDGVSVTTTTKPLDDADPSEDADGNSKAPPEPDPPVESTSGDDGAVSGDDSTSASEDAPSNNTSEDGFTPSETPSDDSSNATDSIEQRASASPIASISLTAMGTYADDEASAAFTIHFLPRFDGEAVYIDFYLESLVGAALPSVSTPITSNFTLMVSMLVYDESANDDPQNSPIAQYLPAALYRDE